MADTKRLLPIWQEASSYHKLRRQSATIINKLTFYYNECTKQLRLK